MNPVLEAALKLLEEGRSVFPVNVDKKPFVKWQEYQHRLPDKDEILEWWTNWLGANIAMATGKLSGVIVVDCDSDDAVKSFVDKFPEAEFTRQVQTARGRHFYFQFEPGIRNDAGKILCKGIDVRGEGGYVVVPPSVHRNNKRYTWLNHNEPIGMPERLKCLLKAAAVQNSTTNDSKTFENRKALVEGTRNDGLTSLGGTMRRKGFSGEAIEAALIEENQSAAILLYRSMKFGKLPGVFLDMKRNTSMVQYRGG